MSFGGNVIAVAQLGLDAILVKPHRAIGPFTAHVTIKETHTDEIEVTEHPVDQGANISDHAFARPAELVIEAAWSNSPPASNVVQGLAQAVSGTINGVSSIISGNAPSQIKELYSKLLQLQKSRIPFQVFTGKRDYADMLCTSLVAETDKETENVLKITARFKQVLIAQVVVRTVSAPAGSQKDPAATMPLADKGLKQLNSIANINPAAALKAGVDAVSAKAQSTISNAISSKVTSLLG